MEIRAYYDKDMLYTNRKIINLDNRVYTVGKVASFNGNDTINTSVVFNMTENEMLPTYIQIMDGSFAGYRYFVTKPKFKRKRQYVLNLLRDILSENQIWQLQPAYIKTGYVFDKTSELKYNRYKFNLNTVKTRQDLLTNDLSLVMFYQQRRNEQGVPVDMQINESTVISDNTVYARYSTMDDFPFKNWRAEAIIVEKKNPYLRYSYEVKTKKTYKLFGQGGYNYVVGEYNRPYQRQIIDTRYSEGLSTSFGRGTTSDPSTDLWTEIDCGTIYDQIELRKIMNIEGIKSNVDVANLLAQHRYGDTSGYKEFNNKIIVIDEKAYKVKFKEYQTSSHNQLNESQTNTVLNITYNEYKRQLGKDYPSSNKRNRNISVYYEQKSVQVELEEYVLSTDYAVTLPALSESMDSVPTKALVINNLTRETYLNWVVWAVNVMQKNKEFYQSQLLPFNIKGDGAFETQTETGKIQKVILRDHSFKIPYTYEQDNEFVEKEARFVRLKSPSGASIMDLTPYLNNGLTGFNVDLSIKPFGTTIYVQPNFSGLYKQNYNDKRGLIIQEDFSISQLDDVWINYKYQNQNYLNTFNRQIESIELNNYYSREADRLAMERADDEAKMLARQTTASEWGMFNDLFLTIPSLIGGQTSDVRDRYNEAVTLDTSMNEALRKDNIALQKEVFNNNLANIKAIAPTLSKVDNFDILYQYSLILEYHECTDAEKEYIINYYENNGANIGTFGYFNDYYGLVISGRLLKSNSNYSQIEMQEINKRLEGGIYTDVTIDTKYINKYGEEVDALKIYEIN